MILSSLILSPTHAIKIYHSLATDRLEVRAHLLDEAHSRIGLLGVIEEKSKLSQVLEHFSDRDLIDR
jgi:hypothetical protein